MTPLEAKNDPVDLMTLYLTWQTQVTRVDLKKTFLQKNAFEWCKYSGVALIYHLNAVNNQLTTLIYNDT